MDNIQQEIIYCGRNEKINIKEETLSTQLEECLKQEEILWKQKSKVKWLGEEKEMPLFS